MSAASQAARDLPRFDTRAGAAAAVEEVHARALPLPRPRAGVRAQAVPRLSLRGALVFLCVMALMFFIVYTYMQMAEMSRASWEIDQDISRLQKEEAELVRQKNGMIDRQEIERIAVEELGMVKPTESQITYIDLSGEDHAEVVK